MNLRLNLFLCLLLSNSALKPFDLDPRFVSQSYLFFSFVTRWLKDKAGGDFDVLQKVSDDRWESLSVSKECQGGAAIEFQKDCEVFLRENVLVMASFKDLWEKRKSFLMPVFCGVEDAIYNKIGKIKDAQKKQFLDGLAARLRSVFWLRENIEHELGALCEDRARVLARKQAAIRGVAFGFLLLVNRLFVSTGFESIGCRAEQCKWHLGEKKASPFPSTCSSAYSSMDSLGPLVDPAEIKVFSDRVAAKRLPEGFCPIQFKFGLFSDFKTSLTAAVNQMLVCEKLESWVEGDL